MSDGPMITAHINYVGQDGSNLNGTSHT